MRMSVRSPLTAGLCAVAAGIIAIPAAVPTPTSTVAAAPTVQGPTTHVALAASVRTLAAEPPDPQQFAAAVGAIERLDPALAQAASTRRSAIAAAALAAADPAADSAAVAPAPLNAASDWITSGYQFIQSWVQYGVSLATYVLQFIPYGYLISSQINIVYYNLIQPIADSVVYGLINPVVNDPLNPAVYVNGLLNVGAATVTALINTGIAEFNYFFGWLIPPIPPIPFGVALAEPELTTLVVGPEALDRVSTTPAGPELTVPDPTVLDATTPDLTEPDVTTPESSAFPAQAEDSEPTGPTAPTQLADPPGPTEATEPVLHEPVLEPVVQDPAGAAEEPGTAVIDPGTTTSITPVVTPAKKPLGTTEPTTTSAGGVQAQGEVRGGTVNAPTTPDDTTPGTTGGAGGGHADPTAPTTHVDPTTQADDPSGSGEPNVAKDSPGSED